MDPALLLTERGFLLAHVGRMLALGVVLVRIAEQARARLSGGAVRVELPIASLQAEVLQSAAKVPHLHKVALMLVHPAKVMK